jgi:hypothetical protein
VLISEWRSALATWWNRRRRFAEEWAFHRDAAIAEFEALGYSRRRAKKAVRQKMGARFRYQHSALAEIGGDLPGLSHLLPIRPVTRSPLFVPVTLAVSVVSALLFSPNPSVAVRCIRAILFCQDLPAAERIISLTPAGVVPVGLAGTLLRTVAVAGLAWAIAALLPQRLNRAFFYSITVLCEIVLGWAVAWVTGMQILAARSWGHDGLQGLALLAFVFGFIGMLYVAMRRWWADVENRCPYCLRLPGMPEARGKAHDVLLDPLEIESICFRGHGVVLQSRWHRRFQAGLEGVL